MALFALAVPTTSWSAVRCVPSPAPDCDSSHATPQAAVDAATNGDTIRIAAGSFPGLNTFKVLTIVGDGAGDAQGGGSRTVLGPINLTGGGTIRALRAQGSADEDRAGIKLSFDNGMVRLTLQDVVAVGADADFGGDGLSVVDPLGVTPSSPVHVEVTGGTFIGGSGTNQPGHGALIHGGGVDATFDQVDLRSPPANTGQRGGLAVANGATVILRRSTATGSAGLRVFSGKATVERSTLKGRIGLLVEGADVAADVTVADSVVSADGQPASSGAAVWVSEGAQNIAARVTLRATTVARNERVASGVRVDGAHSQVSMRNVAVVHSGAAAGPDLRATQGSITADYSSFASREELEGGSAAAPASGHNVGGDAQLDAALHPLSGSPLVDRGDPSIVAAGELDRAGVARSLDGDHDCRPAPDIGAFELEAPIAPCDPPILPPVVSGFRVTNKVFAPAARAATLARRRTRTGTTFLYKLSRAAKVTITIERRRGRKHVLYKTIGALRTRDGKAGRNRIRFSGRIGKRALKQGRYRATLVAVGFPGVSSRARHASFRVVKRR
jgi:hypothetical protein